MKKMYNNMTTEEIMKTKETMKNLWLFSFSEYFGERKQSCEAINIALEAMEKQLPEKPTDIFKSDEDQPALEGYCPYCENWVTSASRYCDECGHALNWDDVIVEWNGRTGENNEK